MPKCKNCDLPVYAGNSRKAGRGREHVNCDKARVKYSGSEAKVTGSEETASGLLIDGKVTKVLSELKGIKSPSLNDYRYFISEYDAEKIEQAGGKNITVRVEVTPVHQSVVDGDPEAFNGYREIELR